MQVAELRKYDDDDDEEEEEEEKGKGACFESVTCQRKKPVCRVAEVRDDMIHWCQSNSCASQLAITRQLQMSNVAVSRLVSYHLRGASKK